MEARTVEGVTTAAEVGACLLTVAGGAMDAWVYLAHGHMFANAQTGNIVLFALHLAAGAPGEAARIAPSIAAFVAGLFCSRLAGAWLKARGRNSRNLRLAAECTILVALALVVDRLPDAVVAACVGFVAAVQITSLSHIGAASFNTGMTTGNLRGAVSAAVAAWLEPSDAADRERAARIGWLCVAFPIGAFLGGVSTQRIGDATLLVIAALVVAAVLAMWRTPDPIPQP